MNADFKEKKSVSDLHDKPVKSNNGNLKKCDHDLIRSCRRKLDLISIIQNIPRALKECRFRKMKSNPVS